MQDDFTSLFAFNRWANAKMLDGCWQKSMPSGENKGPVSTQRNGRHEAWGKAPPTAGRGTSAVQREKGQNSPSRRPSARHNEYRAPALDW